MPICQLCFNSFKNLTSHINAKHGLNKENYLKLYPGEKMVDEDLSKVFVNNSKKIHKKLKQDDIDKYLQIRNQTCKKMRDKKGSNFSHSDETKKKMSLSHQGKLRVPHTQETKDKISKAKIGKKILLSDDAKQIKSNKQKTRWRERKENIEEFSKYIIQLSQARKEYILIHGISIPKKGKKTSLEKRFEQFLKDQNIIDYVFQYFLHGKYYDFYIPTLNLLVEVDGEYWHRLPSAIKNDIEKHIIAKDAKIKLLRITEKNWQPELILETEYNKIQQHNYAIMNKRTNECLNYELSTLLI